MLTPARNAFMMGLLALAPLAAEAAPVCAAINRCVIERKSWERKGWQVDDTKTLEPKTVCANGGAASAQLELGKDLGVALSVLQGSDSEPSLIVELYGDKPTFVLASAAAELSAKRLTLTHRLDPHGKAVVTVDCGVHAQ